jgi:hypothetical protein
MGNMGNAYKILVGKPDGKRSLGWVDNISMDLREIGFGDVNWINLAQDRGLWWAFYLALDNLLRDV